MALPEAFWERHETKPFESRHQPQWQHFEQLLEKLERGRAKNADCQTFVQDYRRLCQHLALAQNVATAAT